MRSSVRSSVESRIAERGSRKQSHGARSDHRSPTRHREQQRSLRSSCLLCLSCLWWTAKSIHLRSAATCSCFPPRLTLARLGCFPSPDPAATGAASQDRRRATARTLARRVPADGRIAPLRTVQIQAYFSEARKGRWRPKRRISRDSGPDQPIGPFRKGVAKRPYGRLDPRLASDSRGLQACNL